MYHPWREFGRWSDWELVWDDLPGDIYGITDWDEQTVTLDRRLLQTERRCTIAHETAHIERGCPPTDPVLRAREEAAIDKLVARQLIGLRDLGEALAWTLRISEAADLLWVDEDTLRVRVTHLHPAERAYLTRRLEHHHD